jgi:hypothetical protein
MWYWYLPAIGWEMKFPEEVTNRMLDTPHPWLYIENIALFVLGVE